MAVYLVTPKRPRHEHLEEVTSFESRQVVQAPWIVKRGRVNVVAIRGGERPRPQYFAIVCSSQHFSALPTTHLAMPSQTEPTSQQARRVLLARPASYLVRAAKSAYYPIKGVWYFLRRPYFYPLFVGRLLPLSIISLLVYFILFTFAFLPQLAFLAIFHGWAGAWINATVLVLGEGLVVIQGIFEGFFVDECRVDVFDVSRPADLWMVTCFRALLTLPSRPP